MLSCLESNMLIYVQHRRLNKVSDGQRRRVQICLGLLKPYEVSVLVVLDRWFVLLVGAVAVH